MTKKIIFIYFVLLLNSYGIYSQSVLSGNLYPENKYLINPAYTGYHGFLNTNFSFRNTSASVDGAPNFLNFGIHSPVYRNMSLGLRLYKQSEGLFSILTGFSDYSYHLKLREKQYLRFGISAGFKSNRLNTADIIAEDPSAIIDVASRNFEGIYFESAAGIVYHFDNFEFSFSLPQLYESKNNFKPQYNSLFSYEFSFNQNSILLKPSILIRYKQNEPLVYDLNMLAFWKNQFYLGLTYRNRPGIILSTGFNFKNVSLSYAVEIGLQKYSNIFNTIHEISVSYTFKKSKPIIIDTLSNSTEPLIAKKDSLVIDSSLTVVKTEIQQTDSVFEGKEQEAKTGFEILEAGNGIYVIHEIVGDSVQSSNIVSNNILSDDGDFKLDDDSILSDRIIRHIEKENNYKLLNSGNGIYTFSSGIVLDSLKNTPENEDQYIDSIIIAEDLLNKLNSDNLSSQTQKDESVFYSIQLFIDDSNNYLFRDAEIASGTWFGTDQEDNFIYYFGHFETVEEAQSNFDRLNKYKDLNKRIIKLNVN